LAIEYSSKQADVLKMYSQKMPGNKNIQKLVEMVEQITKNDYYDVYAIDSSIEIIKMLFKNYNSDTQNSEYLLNNDDNNINKLKMYFFLIIYKLYIYLNSYLQNKQEDDESLLKKNLSFAVRHSNYVLYLEIKKLLRQIFSSKFQGKSEKDINDTIVQIISNIMNNINKDILNQNELRKI
jgi:hypothetical protein